MLQTVVEIAILLLILVEIILSLLQSRKDSQRDKKAIQLQELMVKLLGDQKETLESANEGLADIRDATVEENDEQS